MRRMGLAFLLAAGGAGSLWVGCRGEEDKVAQSPVPTAVTVDLSPLFGSGQTGEAVLEEAGDRVTITLSATGYPHNVEQPVAINWSQPHNDCNFPTSGAVLYSLNSLVDGRSVTTLDTDMFHLRGQAPLVIVIYRSRTENDEPVACGVISPLSR